MTGGRRTQPATSAKHGPRAEQHDRQAAADRAAYRGLTGAARAAAWRILARLARADQEDTMAASKAPLLTLDSPDDLDPAAYGWTQVGQPCTGGSLAAIADIRVYFTRDDVWLTLGFATPTELVAVWLDRKLLPVASLDQLLAAIA